MARLLIYDAYENKVYTYAKMCIRDRHLSDVCPCCGKPAKTMVYWGVAY